MTKLFGVDISGIVAKEVGPGLLDAILIKVIAGTRTPLNLAGGTNPTKPQFTCKGIVEPLSSLRPNSIVADATGAVLLIGDTIQGGQVPETGDEIFIEGTNYTIVKVDRDPAAATYMCQVKS